MSLVAQTPQPTLAWTFDGTTTDYMTGKSGTVVGTTPTYVSGLYKQAISMPNTAGAAASSNVTWTLPSLSTSAVTVSCWLNATTLAAASSSQAICFSAFNPDGDLRIFFNSGTTSAKISITYSFLSGVYIGATSSISYNTGTWNHIAATITESAAGSNVINVYINGSFIGTSSSATSRPRSFSKFTIGSFCSGVSSSYNGLLNDLRIYNSALSAAQIQAIYQARAMPSRGVQISAISPLLSGNARVLYGTAPTGNTAAYFDGSTGTYINLGTSTPVNFNLNTSNIFCEAWIYLNTFDSPSNRIIFHEGTGGLNWSFQVNSGKPFFSSWGTVSGVLTALNFSGSNTTTTSTWAHVAWAYTTAGRPIVYLNGIPELGSPLANYIIGYDSVNNTLIGRNFSPFLNGYIRDLRVIKGGTVPTTSFTPQAAPWAYGSVPSYASGGTNALGLAAQYMTPAPLTGTPLFSQLSTTATSSAVAAFSLRAISGTTVKAVQIKRSSDGATQDFWADRLGNLLTAPVTGTPIGAWLGGSTGNVVTWYDQSGQGQHMAQTTASLQPVLTLATAPPSIVFNGNGTISGQYLQNTIPFTFNFGTNYQYTVRAVVNNTTGGCLVYKGVSGLTWTQSGLKKWYVSGLNGSGGESGTGNYPNLVGYAEGYVYGQTPVTTAKTSITWSSSAFSSVALYENASAVTVSYSRATGKSDPGSFLSIGAGGQVAYYKGNVYEIEIFSSTLGASDVTIMG